ncbi:hypothetical protein V7x_55250 [Crateriforma conspicua]|uniref:Uncharacterized protein n=1 Tax=Crateriforma conspicua TaxID=2527996 RepID=A0A5C6FGG5_9PLAN|nr:hypothetical protein V7x_55250 [Crateriforma conspicua]
MLSVIGYPGAGRFFCHECLDASICGRRCDPAKCEPLGVSTSRPFRSPRRSGKLPHIADGGSFLSLCRERQRPMTRTNQLQTGCRCPTYSRSVLTCPESNSRTNMGKVQAFNRVGNTLNSVYARVTREWILDFHRPFLFFENQEYHLLICAGVAKPLDKMSSDAELSRDYVVPRKFGYTPEHFKPSLFNDMLRKIHFCCPPMSRCRHRL